MMTTNSVMMVWDCQPNDCRNRIAGLKLDHTDENDTLRHKDSSRSIILNRSKSLEKHTDRIEHRADSALYSAAKYSVHCQCLRTYVHFLVGWLLQSDAPMAFCGSASRYQEQCDRPISPVYLSPERWSLPLCYQSLETTWQLYCQCSIANLVLLVPYWQPAAMIASMLIACLIFIQHSCPHCDIGHFPTLKPILLTRTVLSWDCTPITMFSHAGLQCAARSVNKSSFSSSPMVLPILAKSSITVLLNYIALWYGFTLAPLWCNTLKGFIPVS